MKSKVDLIALKSWVASEEEREIIRKAVKKASKRSDQFKRARIISLDRLYRPITR